MTSKKPAGSGRTFIVHGEVFNASGFIHGDRLTVLTTDIDHRSNRGIQEVGSRCMAGYFSDGLVGPRDAVATVSGRNDFGDGSGIDAQFFSNSFKNILTRLPGIITGPH
jgi:hypothetical protein